MSRLLRRKFIVPATASAAATGTGDRTAGLL